MISVTHSIISLVTFVALFRLVITIYLKKKLMVLRIRPARLAWKSKKANCGLVEFRKEGWRSSTVGEAGALGRAGQGRAGRAC